MSEPKLKYIEGKITLSDGTVSKFSITPGLGWSQWGATAERLSASAEVVTALESGLIESDVDMSDHYGDGDE